MGETKKSSAIPSLTDSNVLKSETFEKKYDVWKYVNDISPLTTSDIDLILEMWKKEDEEIRSDLIKSMSQNDAILNESFIDFSQKLQNIYNHNSYKHQARKAIFYELLMTHRELSEEDDVVEALEKYFFIIDELGAMGVEIKKNLKCSMLLDILPPSFEEFRCNIQAGGKLPDLGVLLRKIIEEDCNRPNSNASQATEDKECSLKEKNVTDEIERNFLSSTMNPMSDLSSRDLEWNNLSSIGNESAMSKITDQFEIYEDLVYSKKTEIGPDTSEALKKPRKCGICGIEGHNSRTCLKKITSVSDSKRTVKSPNKKIDSFVDKTVDKSASVSLKRMQRCGICGIEGHNSRTCLKKITDTSVSVSPNRSVTCGLCGVEGHNRRTCGLNSAIKSAVSTPPISPIRSYSCGLCGGTGHYRTTCPLNVSATSPHSTSSSSGRSYSCGICGGAGHNRTTCPLNVSATSLHSTSSSSGRSYSCGVCGGAGHNRTTCPQNYYSAPSYSSSMSSGGGRSYSCGLCGGSGHNRRTCSFR